VGARIVVAPGETIAAGTVVVRDGLIVAVGPDVEVPADARVWKLDGKTVYPGLIESYSRTSIPQGAADRGATHWNALIRPERGAAGYYRADKSLNETLRSQGITCRLVVPDSGVIKGTGALVSTGDEPNERTLIENETALSVRLSVDRNDGERVYPNSPMGAVALARQTFYDADWYRRAWIACRADSGLPRPGQDDALECLGRYIDGSGLVIIETSDEQYLLRADRFAREFALRMAVLGSGREYRRLDAVKACGRTVIVPLDFPKPPNVGTPEAVLDVSLERLMHWDIAPENPARLVAAGVPVVLTGDGLKDRKTFLGAVRTAVERGLDADAALAALTTRPAALFGLSDRMGSIEPGKAAHLVVTDGDLFAKNTRVLATWVDGKFYEVVSPSPIDLRGSWRVAPAGKDRRPFILTLAGKVDKLEGHVRPVQKKRGKKKAEKGRESDSTKLKLAGLRDARFSATFDGKSIGAEGLVQLSAVVSQDADGQIEWLGDAHWPDGERSPIRVEAMEAAADKEAAADEKSKPSDEKSDDASKPPIDRAASFEVNYPLGALGRTAPPDQPAAVVFKNATIWTCEDHKVIEKGSVLIGGGKILAVGEEVEVPRGAVVIDAAGKHITPGVIDCHSHMATDGGINESGQAITSEVRIGDFIDANDVNIYRQLAGGVTASHVLHGSANPIGGQNQLIKLRWGALPEDLKFEGAPPTLKLALGENVKQSNWGDEYTTRYPQTRMGVEQIIRDAFLAAREYEQRWERWRRTSRGLPPRRDLELDPLVEVLNKERWIHCHAYRQDEILALLRTCEDLGIRVAALQHILEGYKVADAMARHGAAGSAFSDWWAYKFEVYDAIPYNGVLMHRAGVLVSFNSDDRELARHLNHEAAKAMKYGGLAPEVALDFVTINPAKQLFVDQWVGSLAPGKQADLVVWSGTPLSSLSRCEQTWIDGRKYFDREEDVQRRQETQRRRAVLVQKILASDEKMLEPGEKEEDPAELWPRVDLYCHPHHENE
jgi:N-acetylglucosamine-6-phosphate deacetylase